MALVDLDQQDDRFAFVVSFRAGGRFLGGASGLRQFHLKVGFFLTGEMREMLVLGLPLERFVPLPLHLLKHPLVIRQPLLLYDLPDLPLDAAPDHSVDAVLLALDVLLGLFLLGLAGLVDFGVEGELLY